MASLEETRKEKEESYSIGNPMWQGVYMEQVEEGAMGASSKSDSSYTDHTGAIAKTRLWIYARLLLQGSPAL